MRMIETTEFPVTLAMGSKMVNGERVTTINIVRKGEASGLQTVLELDVLEWEFLVAEGRRLRGSNVGVAVAKCNAEGCAKVSNTTISGVPFCDDHAKAARKAA